MIYHCNRMELKEDVTPEQLEEALECLRDQGRIPAVTSFLVGPERGSEFDSYDLSDDPDPELGTKIAELQKRNYEANPELVKLMAGLASHTGSSSLPLADD